MSINRGFPPIRRIHARNYNYKEANARLEECVRPYQEQGLNALKVDFFEVLFYYRAFSTQVCTCKQTQVKPFHSNVSMDLPPNVINPLSESDKEITIDFSRPLFGNKNESTNNLDFTSALDFAVDDEDEIEDEDGLPTRTSENLFSADADCGICYRTGYVPGYLLYGYERVVLTTYDLTDSYGYNLNQSTAPHSFDNLDPIKGYVDFTFTVPRYFKQVKYSIRNNNEVLDDEELYLSGNFRLPIPLILQDFKESAGRPITIRVLATKFTHIVIEFDLGIEPLHANIAMMAKNLDWTMMDTLGNLNVILPMTIQEVQSSDFIYVPSRHQVLKVTDTPFLRTAKDKTLDWSISTRICQPQEPPKKIHIGRILY